MENENKNRWGYKVLFEVLDPMASQYPQILEAKLSTANVVFSTVGSNEPVFQAEPLINRPWNEPLPLVSAIGAWRPDMIEVDPALPRHIVAAEDGYNPRGCVGGVILVDDSQNVLSRSGELLRSKVRSNQIIELGEIVGALRGDKRFLNNVNNDDLKHWLADGLIMFKSVGVV